MMEAARTSETSVDNHFTRQYNPEDSSEHFIQFIQTTINNDMFHLTSGSFALDPTQSSDYWKKFPTFQRNLLISLG
jgi:hypothetical protein